MGKTTDIRRRREALRLTQAGLAKLAGTGIRQQDVDRIETGATKFSRHTALILAALDAEERRRGMRGDETPPPAEASDKLPREDVLAALEVLMHILCKSDIAAREAAGALLAAIQAPPPPPLGADRQTVIRIETQRIAGQFSRTAQ